MSYQYQVHCEEPPASPGCIKIHRIPDWCEVFSETFEFNCENDNEAFAYLETKQAIDNKLYLAFAGCTPPFWDARPIYTDNLYRIETTHNGEITRLRVFQPGSQKKLANL